MALVMRRTSPQIANIATAANNDCKRQVPSGGTNYHQDTCELTVTAANAADLPTSIALANQMKAVHNFHCADSLALKAVDSVNPVSTSNAVDLASVITLANALKTSFNAHIALAASHYVTDAVNTVAAANATDQTSANTLLNAIKTSLNTHMAGAPGPNPAMIRLVPA